MNRAALRGLMQEVRDPLLATSGAIRGMPSDLSSNINRALEKGCTCTIILIRQEFVVRAVDCCAPAPLTTLLARSSLRAST
jgi:hypothetical protein